MGIAVALLAVSGLVCWVALFDNGPPAANADVPHSNAQVVPDASNPLPATTTFEVAYAGSGEAVVVAIAEGVPYTELANAGRTNEGWFRFQHEPPRDAAVFAFVRDSSGEVVATGNAVRYAECVGKRVVLPVAPVFPAIVQVRMDAQQPPGRACRIGLTFEDTRLATRWMLALGAMGLDASEILTTGTDGDTRVPGLPAGTAIEYWVRDGDLVGSASADPMSGPLTVVLNCAASGLSAKFRPTLHGSGAAPQEPITLQVEVRQGSEHVLTDTRTIEPGESGSVPLIEGQTVEVSSLSAGYRVVGGKVKLAASPEVQPVSLYTTLSISISIQYADGVAFNGKATALVEAPDGEKWIGDLDFASEPPGSVLGVRELPGLPEGSQFRLMVHQTRAGYPFYEANLGPISAAQTRYDVTIPAAAKGKGRGRFILESDVKVRSNEGRRVAFFFLSGESWRPSGTLELGPRSESKSMLPGTYVIRVTGDIAWQSEPITIGEGEEKIVKVPSLAPASVTCVILNEDGQPMSGASLDLNTMGMPGFPAEERPGLVAVTDETGKATLGGQPSGRAVFRAEAEGYEPVLVEATLASGETFDLGTVQLQRAIGRIEIRFPEGVTLPEGLRVLMNSPWGPRPRAERAVLGSPFLIEGLPLSRLYWVTLAPPRGKSYASYSLLQPTAENPVVVVEVTAAEIESWKNRKE